MNSDNLKNLVAKAPFGYAFHKIIVDDAGTPVDYEFIEVNPAFERLTGLKACDILNKTVMQVVPDIVQDSFNWIGFYGEIALQATEKEFEQYSQTLDRWYKVQAYSPEKYYFITVFSDITDRKQAEENILKSEARYRNIINISPVPMALNDDQHNITLLNPAFVKAFGYTMEDIPTLSHWWPKAYPDPDYRQWVADTWQSERQKSKTTGAAFNPLELTIKCKDGTDKTILAIASSILNAYEGEHLVVLYDITERKQTEKALHKSEEELRKAQQITHIGSWNLDFATNEVIWTPELYKMYGFDPNLPPPPFTEHQKLFTDESWAVLSSSLAETRETGIPYELELKTVRKDGSNGWMWVRGETVTNTKGDTIGLWGAAQDITERKQIEEELRKAKEKAEESDRLKSAFLANMSHEIRTPMNGILGFADLLKEPELSGDEQQNYIRIIERSGARMLNIINDIVDISKIEAGQMEVMIKESNINEQIEYLYTFFTPETERKGIHLSIKNYLQSKESIIKTDREKIFAILTNLIKNAIKFTKQGSIEFGYEKKDEFLEFFVKDTGIGIPKKSQDAIFNRFVQAVVKDKNVYEGAGLGLSIAKAYVEMLGGKIWVESSEGIGSAFYFTIPYNSELQANRISNDVQPVMDAANCIFNLKILIVEDDEDSMYILKKELKNFGKEILQASTGFEAMEAYHANPDIDLIMMDIRIPGMDGLEVTRQIRKVNQDVIIIAQTAFALAGDMEKAIDAGCNDHISKPTDKKLLMELIQTHCEKLCN